MDWFTPKLEPGERVLHRSRLPFVTAWPPGLAALGVPILFVRNWGDMSQAAPVDVAKVLFIAIAGVMVSWAVAILLARAWMHGSMITNRRVIVFRGALRRWAETMELADAENVEFEGQVLILHGAGKTMRLYIGQIDLSRLQKALGHLGPPDGIPAGRLHEMLEPGESLLGLSPSKGLRGWLLVTPSLAVLTMAAMVGLAVLQDEAFNPRGTLTILGFGLLMLSIAANSIAFSRWRTVVTDQRLLIRRGYDYSWCDVLPLSQVDRIAPATSHHSLLELQENGQVVAVITGAPAVATRIRDAIEAAKGAAP